MSRLTRMPTPPIRGWRGPRRFAIALLLTAVLPPASAQTTEPVPNLAQCADVVVAGVVDSVTAGWDAAGRVMTTRVRLGVTSVPRGGMELDSVVFEHLGGETNGVRLDVSTSSLPQFVTGQEVVLLLDQVDGALMARGLVMGRGVVEHCGLLAGRFRLATAADGQRTLRCDPPGPRLWLADGSRGLHDLLGLPAGDQVELARYRASFSSPPVDCPGGQE